VVISLTAEYALRAMLHLATHDAQDAAHTVGQIAAETQVPAGYLAKVLQSLSRAGLIKSQRGLGGGFRLVKPASDTTIYEVVQAVDPLQRIRECPLGLKAHGTNLCPLHRRLDDAMALIEEQFRATTIAELLEVPPAKNKPFAGENLCAFPLTPVAPSS
jgi:Rrf2 family protein